MLALTNKSPDWRKRILHGPLFLYAVFAGCLVGGFLLWPKDKPNEKITIGELSREVALNEQPLITFGDAYLRGEKSVGLRVPQDAFLLNRIMTVTRDENGNVYFVIENLLSSTYGLVLRRDNEEFLGDGIEPQIAEVKHLQNRWWYYHCH